jgi:hypothetical protein
MKPTLQEFGKSGRHVVVNHPIAELPIVRFELRQPRQRYAYLDQITILVKQALP